MKEGTLPACHSSNTLGYLNAIGDSDRAAVDSDMCQSK